MAIVAAVDIVPLGLLFLLSGLVVNLIQAIVFVTLRLFSKTMYRRINRVVVELLWLELVWLIDWWAGVKIQIYADSETFQSSGCLGSTLAVMKNSSKFLPRSWAKDESTLKSGFQRLKDFPRPLWLALFVEGTRFTPAKLLAAQEYAASARLPIPRNVLVPRIKGFVSAVSNMRSFVPAIYDVTVAIPKNESSPTMLRLLKGQSSVVHVHMKRYKMKELPETDDGVAQWCRDIFVVKDALLEKHLAEDTFGDKDFKPIDRPKKSLLVVISWSCFLRFGAFEFFEWSELLSTWKGLAFSITGLLVVMIVMYIFILFSQSESSASAKAAAIRSKSGGAPSDPNLNKQH